MDACDFIPNMLHNVRLNSKCCRIEKYANYYYIKKAVVFVKLFTRIKTNAVVFHTNHTSKSSEETLVTTYYCSSSSSSILQQHWILV